MEKKRYIQVLILMVFIIILLPSCSDEDTGTKPQITNVLLYRNGGASPTTSFQIGDYANFALYASDPDLDMEKMFLKEYQYPDLDNAVYQIEFICPSQSEEDAIFYSLQNINIVGPAGTWRISFQVRDGEGNKSNIFYVNVSVTN